MNIIKSRDFDEARKKIKKSMQKNEGQVVFSSDDDELNRKILEKEKIDILLINFSGRKDKAKQRDSGFNQVLAKIAKKSNVTIGINLDEIISGTGKQKAEILARLRQNIRLCNKNHLKMKFIAENQSNERNIYDLRTLGIVLGMPTNMTKNL